MASSSFKPIVYCKQGCPFSLKVRLMLLEAGLLDEVEIRELAPDTQADKQAREELAPHFEKVSFPSAQIAPGRYIGDSDAIIAHFAEDAGVDAKQLPTLQAYAEGPFAQLGRLYGENMSLKKQLAGD